MKKLVLSTGNKGKLVEIKGILEELSIEVITKNDLGLEDFDVVEDGKTLEENAIKKAVELKKLAKGIVMADDTGLFVEALNGAPGLYTARYGGEDGNSEKNKEKLLKELEGVENRKAYFETVIALVLEDGSTITISGICRGTIASEESGVGGFGYDPLFIPEGYKETFAELGLDIKNKISHRAIALDKMKTQLIEILRD